MEGSLFALYTLPYNSHESICWVLIVMLWCVQDMPQLIVSAAVPGLYQEAEVWDNILCTRYQSTILVQQF